MALKTLASIREGTGVTVTLREDETTGLRHVVKEVSVPDTDGYITRQVRAEYELLKGLDHPRLLKVQELRDDGRVLVYADAQCNLAQYLARKGKVSPVLALNLLEQVAQGLQALHAAGLCHTSLGATSIFVGHDGQLLLGDFLPFQPGGSEPMPDPDPVPRYQAPECNDSAFGPVSPGSDLYSLGYLALEAMTGAGYPGLFAPGEQGDNVGWHLDPTRRLQDLRGTLPDAPSGLLDLIDAITKKSPPQRGIKSAKDFLDQLAKRKLVTHVPFPPYEEEKGVMGLTGGPVTPPRVLILKPQGLMENRDVVLVPGKPVLVGAQPGCDLLVRGKGMASRHALLFCDRSGQWLLFDLRGRGDCHVDDIREPVMPLKKGDLLRIGLGSFLVDFGEALDGSRKLCGVNVARQIGKTREGKLFLGNWEKRGHPVVLHVFPVAFGEDEAWVKRLLQDSSTLARLHNKAILPMFEVGRRTLSDHKILWYLIREYSLRGNMNQRIEKGEKPPPQRLTRYASSACKALAESSSAGITHGCLHPGSLLFDPADRLRVAFVPLPLDGRIGYRDEAGRPLLGSTVPYRAPELFGTSAPGTVATDVYALAACLLHYVSGHLPFDAGVPSLEVVKRLKEHELREIKGLPAEYPAGPTNAFFKKALHPDPAQRFKGPGDFILAMRHTLFPGSLASKGKDPGTQSKKE